MHNPSKPRKSCKAKKGSIKNPSIPFLKKFFLYLFMHCNPPIFHLLLCLYHALTLVGTTVVVLKDGKWEDGSPRKTMGKVIDSNEAHLAGILVDPKSTEQGLGEKIYQEADEVARKAGKKFISTVIDDNNYASMRLNFKSGYVLEGERENKYRKEGQPIEYMYKKDLEKEDKKTKENYLGEVKYRNVDLAPDDLEEDSARQVLINPEDTKKMKQALELGYLGKFLFRKEEHQKNDQSLMLFEK